MLFPPLTKALARTNGLMFSVYAIAAAFSTYFCMYAFRKPFAAGTFDGDFALPLLASPIAFKTLLIISQVAGYCTSKFLGIKVISEMPAQRRALSILGVIGFAWFALLLFAVLPRWAQPLCLFLNGLPLGMVWGLVFGFLEGRKLSEVLGAGLSASYILASGVVKGVGKSMVSDYGIPEQWMPFATGALFVLPMAFFVWMLANLPPPSAEDEALRTKREPMDATARKAFFLSYLPGLLPLTALYIVLTAYRDFRDNFAVEIWDALGYADEPAILAWSELPITVVVLGALALLMLIKDNRTALIAVHVIMLVGTGLIGVSTLLYQLGILPPAFWMIAVGAGLYIAYVPYGCVLFDRLIAAVGARDRRISIYVTDAFGYLGAVLLMLYKDLGQPSLSISVFTYSSYGASILCTSLFIISTLYFAKITTGHKKAA